jgi:hypothetical protein
MAFVRSIALRQTITVSYRFEAVGICSKQSQAALSTGTPICCGMDRRCRLTEEDNRLLESQ